jgi:hypothetical protein
MKKLFYSITLLYNLWKELRLMDIIVFGIKYDTIKAALEAYGLTPARYERWKNYYDTPGEAIEAMLRKDKERKEEKDRIRAINEAGITEYMYDKYKNQADTIEEIIALAKTGTHVEPYAGLILMFCTAVARAVGTGAACNGDVVVLVGLRVLDVQLVVGHDVIARRRLLPFLDGLKILSLHSLVYDDVPVPVISRRRSSS